MTLRNPSEAADRLIAEGNRAESAGNLHEACERYRRAVAVAPGYAKAHLNLGIGLEAVGATDHAIRSYETALAIDPADAYSSYNLGKLRYTRGALAEAERLLRYAIDCRPDFPEAHVVLSSVSEAQGNLVAAAAALEVALKQRPDHFGALCNYGAVLRKLNRLTDAESALRRAIAIEPENVEANYDLATLLAARGALPDAERILRRILERRPEFMDARAALIHVCDAQGNLAAAATELEAALQQRPDWVEALYNYGCVLKNLLRLAEAEAAFRRAIAIDSGYFRAYRMLGGVLLGQCRIGEAIELYGAARQRWPDNLDLESAELFALNCSEDVSSDALFEKHAAFGARLEKARPARFEAFHNVRDPERRLRIGYVSGDFCYHVVTLFVTPLIERHDRSACEVYCYSTGSRVDDYTRQLSARADVWRHAAAMSESELADAINRDRIDILVDLGGHSGIPQLGVFAQQPAPVQATWLGYLNTTGMTRIQYRISDGYSDPPGLTDRFHTETLLRLPNSQWCYRPFISVDSSEAPPLQRNGFATFGSFNQAMKLSRSVRRLWAEILTRLPDSRLVVLGVGKGRAQDDLLKQLANAGVDRGRITILSHVSLTDYFGWFDAVDIALDTTPYSGGTTTCDALWMGVPVVTVPGSRPASRSTASILSTVGLTDWIGSAPDDYVRLAVKFAREETTLRGLRRSLRQRIRASPLMDETRFARDVEDAYRRMWRTWCGGAKR